LVVVVVVVAECFSTDVLSVGGATGTGGALVVAVVEDELCVVVDAVWAQAKLEVARIPVRKAAFKLCLVRVVMNPKITNSGSRRNGVYTPYARIHPPRRVGENSPLKQTPCKP
jgi:hypothetical protein